MQLLSFNIWGGTQGQVLLDYIKDQAKNTDIFCFQEVFSATEPSPKTSSQAQMYLFEEFSKLLPEFNGIFSERSSGFDFNGPVSFPVKYGLAIFIRKNINIISSDATVINCSISEQDDAERITLAQVINLESAGKNFAVINYHGPAQPGTKLDTQERIDCSQKLKNIWMGFPTDAKILCGDFNLMPETESIKILEGCGKNLIKEFKIENTRNEVSWKRFNNKQCFADYAFVSSSVKVNSFEVPYNEFSDHLPMVLSFE
jgi:endonuclease/exonuclease/phosphatase family metal-dependent hydrolase